MVKNKITKKFVHLCNVWKIIWPLIKQITNIVSRVTLPFSRPISHHNIIHNISVVNRAKVLFLWFFFISLRALGTTLNLYFNFHLSYFSISKLPYPELQTYLFMYYQKVRNFTYSEIQINVKFDLQYFNIIQTTSLFKSLMNSKIEEVFWNFEHSTLGVMKWALVWLMWIYHLTNNNPLIPNYCQLIP